MTTPRATTRVTVHPTRRITATLAAAALCVGLTACGADNENPVESDDQANAAATSDSSGGELEGTISGAGSSAQSAAMQAWIAAFGEDNPDATINYEPSGSGAGRDQFTAGAVAFAGSDAALEQEEFDAAKEKCGDVVQVPLYISPIAVAFNLEGIDSLNLSAETIAGIFDQKITNWNDEAIAADNPDVELPDLEITPVNRSDESGTTENFVEYLSGAAEDAWPHEVSGDWPVDGGEAAQGTQGVVGAIGGGEGTIGYADLSQVGDLGVVKVGVGEEFVEPSSEAAAKILAASERVEGQGDHSYTYELDRATEEAGTYPVVLVSYNLACTEYDSAETADLVKEFFTFVASEEGQQVAEEQAGSAPLSDEQREEYTAAIDAISGG